MSFPQLCPSCSRGHHSGHRTGTGRPGLIGGTTCECPGDCAIQFQNQAGQTLTALQLAENQHMTLRQYHELLEQVRSNHYEPLRVDWDGAPDDMYGDEPSG